MKYLVSSIKYKKSLSTLFFVLILNAFTLMLYTTPVSAEGIALSVSPSLLQIQVMPPAEAKTPLTLQNQGTEPLNIQVLFKPFRAYGEAGEIEYINEQAAQVYKDIFSQIKLTDDGIVSTHFELGPKQKKNLELHFTIPKNDASKKRPLEEDSAPVVLVPLGGEKRADYYFSVIFLASPKPLLASRSLGEDWAEAGLASTIEQSDNETTEQSNISTINAGIAANVLLSVGSINQPKAAIEEFSAPAFLQSGPVEFTTRIKNTGPHLIKPKGIIFIKNIFGQTIGRLDILPANILSGSTRSLTDVKTASGSAAANDINQPLNPGSLGQRGEVGSVQKVMWEENFLLGPYTATLNLALSEKGPIYNKSIVFLAVPIHLIIGIFLALLITIIVFLRVRFRLKTDR